MGFGMKAREKCKKHLGAKLRALILTKLHCLGFAALILNAQALYSHPQLRLGYGTTVTCSPYEFCHMFILTQDGQISLLLAE